MTKPSVFVSAGGAGYVVTIAHTLHRSAHTNRPAAIVAVDVTVGYLYKMLLAAEPECGRADAHIRCFLMDDAGFVLAHPSVLEPLVSDNAAAMVDAAARIRTLRSPAQQQLHRSRRRKRRRPLEHVTHVESYMANDLLNWRQLVEKHQCDDFADRTRQRFYR